MGCCTNAGWGQIQPTFVNIHISPKINNIFTTFLHTPLAFTSHKKRKADPPPKVEYSTFFNPSLMYRENFNKI